DIQTKNAGYGGNGNRNAGRQNKNQAFNAGNGLTRMMKPADDKAVTEPNYDAKAVSELLYEDGDEALLHPGAAQPPRRPKAKP
ncbi:hypothetical protein Tco_1140218, partial [Tanacetum coccineum]